MGRPRKYATEAERQRACRERLAASTVRVDRRALDQLHLRLEQLQEALWRAEKAGDETARVCGAASVETMLEKLIRHFQASAAAGSGSVGENVAETGREKGGRRARDR
jgi:hypothetical protein